MMKTTITQSKSHLGSAKLKKKKKMYRVQRCTQFQHAENTEKCERVATLAGNTQESSYFSDGKVMFGTATINDIIISFF